MARNIPLLVVMAVGTFLIVSFMMSFGDSSRKTSTQDFSAAGSSGLDLEAVPASILSGGSIAPKLENATAKYVYT